MDRVIGEALAELREAHEEREAATLRFERAIERLLALGGSPCDAPPEQQIYDMQLSLVSDKPKARQRNRLSALEMHHAKEAVAATVRRISQGGGSVKLAVIATAVGISRGAATGICQKLLHQKKIMKAGHGYYRWVDVPAE